MFGYLRIFSLLSLLTIIAVAGLAGMSMRTLAIECVTRLTGDNNAALAQGYVNTVWSKYRSVIVPLAATPAKLRDNPQVAQFAQETAHYFDGLPLLRVNIYSADGALLITADISSKTQLTNTAASPDGHFAAGRFHGLEPASQVVDHAPLQNGESVTLVQTMVPIRPARAGTPEGSMEILSDVTNLWMTLWNVQLYATGGIILGFLVVLGILFLMSKRAEGIIARQHEANVELAAAAATAQAENRDKSQFLANISHELRTPLNAIIGFSDIIRNDAGGQLSDKKSHDYINDIHASGVHLLSLINDILDYSKAEAGKLELEVSEVNATKIVQNCLRLIQPRADSAQVNLVEALPKEAFILTTDGKKFKQIILNLLSNAVKFTRPGGKVSVTAWRNIGEESYSFEVQDTGIGIAPKDISRAMSPFGQVDNTLKRKYEGTGLGLPLTKKFVELMGGKFMIESKVDVGTKISFSLPREVMPREGVIIKQVS